MGLYKIPKLIGINKKPSFGTRVNWHHPLSQGLVGAWLLNEGGGLKAFDIVNNLHGSLSGTNKQSWTNDGLYTSGGTNGGYVLILHDSKLIPAQMTIFIKFIKFDTANAGLFTKYSSSYWLAIANADVYFSDKDGHETTRITTNLNTIQTVSCSVGDGKFYINANDIAYSGVYTYTGNTGTNNIWIGGLSEVTSWILNGYVYCAYLWDRVLTANEHISLHANPYQMFWHPMKDIYIIPAAAPPPTGGRSIFGYDNIFHSGGIIQT